MGFPLVPEELLPVLVPTAAYWIASLIYELMMTSMEKNRLFTALEEDTKNLVSRSRVLVGVLTSQAIQASLALLVYMVPGGGMAVAGTAAASPPSSLLHIAWQLVLAYVVTDTWNYFWHRLAHTNKFIYKHLHSMHHRLIVPYSFGAWYFHPLDLFFGDLVGGTLATLASGMSPRTSAFFFTVLTLKGVDDHCGMWFPYHPIHRFLTNNGAFHALHHQHEGVRHNFSGYYLAFWDTLLGTYLPYAVDQRKGGGYQLRAIKD